ncbi:MAG: hypothetical protein LBN02_02585 [Oscillospiraceae bacterium]|jgi:hypothetical protein|nr:hypothetical protein [Oscillospiraceae bacterium]
MDDNFKIFYTPPDKVSPLDMSKYTFGGTGSVYADKMGISYQAGKVGTINVIENGRAIKLMRVDGSGQYEGDCKGLSAGNYEMILITFNDDSIPATFDLGILMLIPGDPIDPKYISDLLNSI